MSTYPVHQAINRPVTFKGLKAQYMMMAAAALVGDLLLFVIGYIAGLDSWLDMLLAFGLGTITVSTAYRMSKKYGEFGLMKKTARKKVPRQIRYRSRQLFLQLKKR
jgi:hypothetical protein